MDDEYYMRLALMEAEIAYSQGEVPVGAVLVLDGEVLCRAHNARESSKDPTAHAEVLVLREGARMLDKWRLSNTVLYVTKEPCIMCSGAVVNARVARVVFGCADEKAGGMISLYSIATDKRLNHRAETVSGVLEEECVGLLRRFFRRRRKNTGNTAC